MTHIPAGWEDPGTLVFHAGDEDIELVSLLDRAPAGRK
jgi:hypothetical protein